MHTAVGEKNIVLYQLVESVTRCIQEKYTELRVPAIRLDVVTDMKLLKAILDMDKYSYCEVQKSIIQKVRKYSKILLSSNLVKRKDKIKIASLMFGKKIFCFVYTIGDLAKK